jgi:hypothetical protein
MIIYAIPPAQDDTVAGELSPSRHLQPPSWKIAPPSRRLAVTCLDFFSTRAELTASRAIQ